MSCFILSEPEVGEAESPEPDERHMSAQHLRQLIPSSNQNSEDFDEELYQAELARYNQMEMDADAENEDYSDMSDTGSDLEGFMLPDQDSDDEKNDEVIPSPDASFL